MEKIQNDRMGRLTKQQRENLLPNFIENPELLVGRTIQHRVSEEDSEEVFWCRGDVVKISKLTSVLKKTEYEIRYDNEPDNIWSFPLLIDLEKGDLFVI